MKYDSGTSDPKQMEWSVAIGLHKKYKSFIITYNFGELETIVRFRLIFPCPNIANDAILEIARDLTSQLQLEKR